MKKTFYISDTHFGHRGIIKLCGRPFGSVEEMDEALVAKWNAKVGPEDIVYHLGDFSWPDKADMFHRLNGEKHLLIGNHDYTEVKSLPWYSAMQYREVEEMIGGEKKKLVLFHYPIADFHGQYKGGYHFYGHVHNTDPSRFSSILPKNAFNVGVEMLNYEPKTFVEIVNAEEQKIDRQEREKEEG